MLRRFSAIAVLALVALATPAAAQDRGTLVSVLKNERAKYGGHLEPAELAKLLNDTAARVPGWGLLAKEGGNNCPLPNGVKISCDWLVHKASGQGCDALRASEDVAEPSCGSLEPFDVSKFVDPLRTTPGEDPVKPTDPAPGVDVGASLVKIIALLERIEQNTATIHGDTWATASGIQKLEEAQREQTAALKRSIDELQAIVKAGVPIRIR